MRKNLSGKTEWVKHTRNTSKGRRGVNRAERAAARDLIAGRVPEDSAPKVSRPKRKKRWGIECRFVSVASGLPVSAWMHHDWYPTKAERDQALKSMSSREERVTRARREYRAVER